MSFNKRVIKNNAWFLFIFLCKVSFEVVYEVVIELVVWPVLFIKLFLVNVNYLLLIFWLDKLIMKVLHANLVYLDHNYNLYKYLMREINVDFNQKNEHK